MFKIGDCVDYGFYKNLTIVDKDEKHYILENQLSQQKKVFISLVESNAVLRDSPAKAFIREYENLCQKYKMYISHCGSNPCHLMPKNEEELWPKLLEKHIEELEEKS